MTARRATVAQVGAVMSITLVLYACGAGDDSTAPTEPPASVVPEVEITPESFPALENMTPVRGFFVDNLLGDLDATLEVANSPDGGTYPVGTLIQLVPQEAMVKREPGFSPETNDWEFFELEVSPEGTVINVRGGDEVVNRFGGSCAGCHSLADPQFDMVCEQTHGCDPLPIDRDTIEIVQNLDPRPVTG